MHLHISSLAKLPQEQQTAVLDQLTEAQCKALMRDWPFWARPEQLPPPGDWATWLYLAGRGSGKTRTGAEWIRAQVKAGHKIVGMIAPTAGDARRVMVEGESGLLACCWPGDVLDSGQPMGAPIYEPSNVRVVWPDCGAVAYLYSAEEPERLRGPQHSALWCDEIAAWKRMRETYDMAMFGLRLGAAPQAMVTTTPRPVPLLRELLKDVGTVVSRGSTFDNAANLAPSFLAKIRQDYDGTRLGRQELYAEILDDVENALWTRDSIITGTMPEMQRIIVAVDPSGASGAGDGDDIGIVVAGKGMDGRFYVIEDATCNLAPAGWGRRTVERYAAHRADCIVAEKNFGGAMVEAVIRTAERNAKIKMVTASRGKAVRAEPIAALYEQGRVTHARGLDALEDQMMQFTLTGYMGDGSPDRVDALVWALSELALGDQTHSWEGAI